MAVFLSNLSCIAWLLNIRGNDVDYNPVAISYLFITTKQAFLFVDKAKVSTEVQAYLKEQGISIRDYSDVWSFLRRAEWGDGKVLIDPKTPYAVSLMLTSARYMLSPSFVEQQKAIKNDSELHGMRNAYVRDGAAMVCSTLSTVHLAYLFPPTIRSAGSHGLMNKSKAVRSLQSGRLARNLQSSARRARIIGVLHTRISLPLARMLHCLITGLLRRTRRSLTLLCLTSSEFYLWWSLW